MRYTTEIGLPLLYDKNMNPVRRLHPVSASLSLSMAPPSSATMILPKNEEVSIRDFVQMNSPARTEGIFRVSSVQRDYVTGETTVMLEHAICILDDSIANEGLHVVTVVAPQITTQPANTSVVEGGTAVFTVAATGTGLTYQWQYKSPTGSWTNSAASTATTASLSIGAISSRNGYKYRCVVTGLGGATVISNAATLTVTSASAQSNETNEVLSDPEEALEQEETSVQEETLSANDNSGKTASGEEKISTKTDVEKTTYAGTAQTVLSQILASQHVLINNIVPWVVNTNEAANEQVSIEVNHDTLFDLFVDYLDQLPGYYAEYYMVEGLPWKINIVAKPSTATAEGRLSRNISSCVISYDDSELCTRVYVDGVEGGKIDADTISQYGIVEEYLDSGDALGVAERTAIVNKYLNLHKRPKVSISIDGQELFQITGETLDAYKIGKLYRLALPEYGTVENELITGIYYQSLYDNPGQCRLTLANEAINLASELDKLKKKVEKATGGGGGGGGGGGIEDLAEELEILKIKYDLQVEKDDKRFAIIATEAYWDELQERYELAYETFFEQTSRYIQLIATATELSEAEAASTSLFRIASDLIELRVEKAGVIAAINLSAEGVQIQAAKVDLGEYATVGQLDAKYATITNLDATTAKIDNLMSGATTATSLRAVAVEATSGTFSNIVLGGQRLGFTSQSVVTGVTITMPSVTLGGAGRYLYGTGSGDSAVISGGYYGYVVSSATAGSYNVTSTTLNYIGGSSPD